MPKVNFERKMHPKKPRLLDRQRALAQRSPVHVRETTNDVVAEPFLLVSRSEFGLHSGTYHLRCLSNNTSLFFLNTGCCLHGRCCFSRGYWENEVRRFRIDDSQLELEAEFQNAIECLSTYIHDICIKVAPKEYANKVLFVSKSDQNFYTWRLLMILKIQMQFVSDLPNLLLTRWNLFCRSYCKLRLQL